MTDHPTPGKPLDQDSVKLLLPGDVIDLRKGNEHGMVILRHICQTDVAVYASRFVGFTFVSRPTPQDQGSSPQEAMPAVDVDAAPVSDLKPCPQCGALPCDQTLSPSPANGTGWRGIETHDNSREPVLVEDAKGKRVMAWRHHPSSRTDQWLTIPGSWQITPVRFFVPPPPVIPDDQGAGDSHDQ